MSFAQMRLQKDPSWLDSTGNHKHVFACVFKMLRNFCWKLCANLLLKNMCNDLTIRRNGICNRNRAACRKELLLITNVLSLLFIKQFSKPKQAKSK